MLVTNGWLRILPSYFRAWFTICPTKNNPINEKAGGKNLRLFRFAFTQNQRGRIAANPAFYKVILA